MSPNNAGVAVNIRGFEGSGRVNTMIDGVRQNFRFTGHEAQGFTYIDPLLLAGIEMQRGAVSTAGGAGALAGTANFRTLDVEDILKPGQTQGALTNGSWGSNGLGWSGMAAGAVHQRLVGVAGAISGHNENNYENGDGVTVPYTFQDLTSGLVKADFQIDEEQSIKFGGVFYDNDFLANSYYPARQVEHVHGQVRLQPARQRLDQLLAQRLSQRSRPCNTARTSPPTVRQPATRFGRRTAMIDDEGWGFDVSNMSRFNLGARAASSRTMATSTSPTMCS